MTPIPSHEALVTSANAVSTAVSAGADHPSPHIAVQVDPLSATKNNPQDPDPANIHGDMSEQPATHLPNRLLGIPEYQSRFGGNAGENFR